VQQNPDQWDIAILDGKVVWKNNKTGEFIKPTGSSTSAQASKPIEPVVLVSTPAPQQSYAATPMPQTPQPSTAPSSGPSILEYLTAASSSIAPQSMVYNAGMVKQKRRPDMSTGAKVAIVVGGVAVVGILIAGIMRK
jgi:hypothetical protein